MTYDWNAELPPCDGCGEEAEESTPWVDREGFWGHLECYRAACRVLAYAEREAKLLRR